MERFEEDVADPLPGAHQAVRRGNSPEKDCHRAGSSLAIPAELGQRGGKRLHGKEKACQRIN
jgi:hypothetical protein